MSDLQHSVKQRFRNPKKLQQITWIFLFLGILFIPACDTEQYQNPGQIGRARYLYELRITTTESYSQSVHLKKAQIRINGKEQTRIAFIAGTRIIEVPFQYIQRIRFSNIGPSSPYSGMNQRSGNNRIRMEIFAEGETGQPNGVSITCDSIPDFYVIGQESRYVKRVFRNDAENFDMQEIQILQITDLAAKPQTSKTEPSDPRLP